MSRLDEELKIALARHEPPENFAQRVMARIALGQATPETASERWWRPILRLLTPGLPIRRLFEVPKARWATIGAVACLILTATAMIGSYRYREYQREKAQAELAKAQVIYALQVASTTLNTAQRKALGIAPSSIQHSN